MCFEQVASTGKTCNGDILRRKCQLGSVLLIFKINNTFEFPFYILRVSEVRFVSEMHFTEFITASCAEGKLVTLRFSYFPVTLVRY